MTKLYCLLLSAVAAGFVALAWPAGAGADQELSSLAKFDKPVDDAMDKALEFLAAKQEPDGSFGNKGPARTAVTSLVVMAFLSKGHLPGLGPYGEVINKGVDFTIKAQHSSGLICAEGNAHGAMYSHGIGTLMLSEVSGMLDPQRQAACDAALSKAVKVILAAQTIRRKNPKEQGGWRYQSTSNDSDISVTSWQMMALRSARNNGAPVPREAIDEAVKFLMNCRAKDGGFAYQPGESPGLARTGTALLCLELCGKHRDDATIGAGNWTLKKLPKDFGGGDGFFYYGMYYCSQGMFQLGEKYWEQWAQNMYTLMLKFQNKDGSWPVGGGNENQAGPCYSTAMAVLAMSVSCRQLPIYQR
jgi:prenyltransferase beta subunit